MSQLAMEQLFDVYYHQCPNSKISYALYNEVNRQGHIVLAEGIQIIYFEKYQDSEDGVIRFAFSRGEHGDEVFFVFYEDAKKHFEMPIESFEAYIESITL